METEKLKEKILSLPTTERERLMKEVGDTIRTADLAVHASRRHELDNRMGCCPHCSQKVYIRYGTDNGVQRYKCRSCNRGFTEYTGTWMEGLQRRDKVGEYLELMINEDSLDKISETLKINKKTAFDWRHKILASLGDDGKEFTGITESDEFFFLRSEKGMDTKGRKPRKRGGRSKKRGVSNEQVAVIVTQDRMSGIDLSVATLGRISKEDLENAIGARIKKGSTVLCSDAHNSYRGFAGDTKVEFHSLNASKGERVKGVYHIQHVNSTHNKIRKWLGNTFWGVSTKYLQQYMNWHRLKEGIKSRSDRAKAFVEGTMNLGALERFWQIQPKYEKLITTEN